MRRGLYWLGVLAGVALLAGGVTIATLGYAKTAGPQGAVRGYFGALAAGDAATALAYGDVPDGATTLLTSDVLREQLRIAPLRDFDITATRQHGNGAIVQVKYTLAFPGTEVPVSASLPLHDSGGRWRLDRVAVGVQLHAGEARQRQSILGAPVPHGPVLLFPGALPISVDTPYLKLDPFSDFIAFDSLSFVDVRLQVTDAARSAFARAVAAQVRDCVAVKASDACPLPDERYVPGSVHGTVQGGVRATNTLLDVHSAVGRLQFSGRMTVNGSYRRLNFHNVQVAGRGPVYLDVHATAFAVPPLRLRWTSP
jgi:hypothetical protein